MKLETERLYLRELTPDDFDALYAVLADSDIMQHYPYTFDEARVRNWINKNIKRYVFNNTRFYRKNYEKLQENNHNAADRSHITNRRFYDGMHQTVGSTQ